MVVQATTDTRDGAEQNKARKSSLEFLESVLRPNGFGEVRAITPRGYTRPLLIGRRSAEGSA